MFVTKENKVLSVFAQPMTNICVNIIHRLVLKHKKVRKLLARVFLLVILRVLFRLGKISIMEIYQTIFLSTGMV
jgi:hypothetical protein